MWLAAGFLFLASLVQLPQGPMFDEWCFLALAEDGRAPWDLFRYSLSDAPHSHAWYLAPEAEIAFFRPLSSMWFWAESQWLPAWTWHLTNSVLAVVVGLLAVRTYRTLGPKGPWWVLAGLGFLLDDAHAAVWAWAGHRNALLAMGASLISFLWFRSSRVDGRPALLGAAAAAQFVGLLCGELAIVGLALPVGWALFARPQHRRGDLLATVPLLLIGTTFLLAVGSQGYATTLPGMYLHPIREPIAWLTALPARLPLLLTALAAPIWVEASSTLPAIRDHHLGLGLALLVGLGAIGWLLRRPLTGSPRARVCLAWTLLTLVPLTAVQPHDRLLLLPGLGFFGLVAEVLVAHDTWSRRLAPVLIGLHLVLGPLLTVPKALFVSRLSTGMSMAGDTLDRPGPVFLVRDQGNYNTLLVGNRAQLNGVDVDLRTLGRTHGALTLARTGPRQLELATASGRHFFDGPSDHMGLGVQHAPVGSTFDGRGYTAKIIDVDGASGHPTRVRFEFDGPIEDARFGELRVSRLVELELPAVGDSLDLPAVDPPAVLHHAD